MLTPARRCLAALVLAAAGLAPTSLAMAQPVSDEVFNAALADYQTKDKAVDQKDYSGHTKLANELVKSLGADNLSVAQIEKLAQQRILRYATDHTDAVKAHLNNIAASDKTENGFKAALFAMDMVAFSPKAGQTPDQARADFAKTRFAAFMAALDHPGIAEAAKSGSVSELFGRLGNFDPSSFKGTNAAERIAALISPSLTGRAALNAAGAFDVLCDEDSGTSPEVREAIRTKLLAALDNADKGIAADDKQGEQMHKWIASRKAYLAGAYATGKLVGFPAPAIDFTWTSPDLHAKSLADLKGKVVVVDFWATWCGPCVGSFPRVRELQDRYKGYPVTIVGVTSLQGSSTVWKNGKVSGREDTKGDPAKEYSLMSSFIKDMDMTWNVAFSSQDVFNPDYGVRGIPHVVIIDPNGVVRFRGLHPASDPQKKHDMIDGLLKEFNLPYPQDTKAEPKPEEKPDAKSGGAGSGK